MKRATIAVCFALFVLAIGNVRSAEPQADQPRDALRYVNAAGLSTPPGYSHAVAVERGKLVYVSGQVALNAKGEVPSDFRAEVAQAFQNLRTVLAAAGATPADVVKLNYYVVGLNHEKLLIVRDARDAFIAKDHAPASTLAGVAALFREDCHIEIEAVAVSR